MWLLKLGGVRGNFFELHTTIVGFSVYFFPVLVHLFFLCNTDERIIIIESDT